jgi:hypothetical protein
MILPQSAVLGSALGYMTLAAFAFFFKSETVIDIAAYLITGFWAFYAHELRQLVRRISRI